MTPLPVLLLLVAACPASVVLQSQRPGEVVTSESSRDVTRTQSSTSQSSETKRITSGDFQNTTNTQRSTATESQGKVHERSGARPEGSYALHELKDVQHKDDNKTGPDGTERTQSIETTEVKNLGVAGANGRDPLQVGAVQKTLVENVTRSGARSGPAKENTERNTNIRTVAAGVAPDNMQITLTQDDTRRSINGEDPRVKSSSTVEVEEPLGTRISGVSPETANRIQETALSEVQERIRTQSSASETILDSEGGRAKDVDRSIDPEIKPDMSTTKVTDAGTIGVIRTTSRPSRQRQVLPLDQVQEIRAKNVSRTVVSPMEKDNTGEAPDTEEVTLTRDNVRPSVDGEDPQGNSSNGGEVEERFKSRGSTIVDSESRPDSVPKPGRDAEVPKVAVTTPPPPATTAAPLPDGTTVVSEPLPQLDFSTIAPITTPAPELVPVTIPVPDSDPKTTPNPSPATEPTQPTQPPPTPGSSPSFGGNDYLWTLPPPPSDATTTPRPSTTPVPEATTGDWADLRYPQQGQPSECPTCKAPCEGPEQQKCCWMSSSYCVENGFSDARFQACERCWGDEKANAERWKHI